MATIKGGADMRRFFANLPGELEKKVLRPAARAGAKIIADEARARAPTVTAENIVTQSRIEPGRVTINITVKPGWGRSIGYWAEYGTREHFISVDDSQSGGRSARRINYLGKAGSLVIGGKFVGSTVRHPGADPHPFLRPALDLREADAFAAAQSTIAARIRGGRIVGAEDVEGDEE